MNNIILDKTYYLEIPANLTGGVQKIPFPQADLQDLKGKYLQGMDFFTVTNQPKCLSSIPCVNDNVLKSSFLTLVVENNEIWNIPVVSLIPSTFALVASPYKVEFNNLAIQWGKCYITVADVALFAATQENFALNIAYSDK